MSCKAALSKDTGSTCGSGALAAFDTVVEAREGNRCQATTKPHVHCHWLDDWCLKRGPGSFAFQFFLSGKKSVVLLVEILKLQWHKTPFIVFFFLAMTCLGEYIVAFIQQANALGRFRVYWISLS